MLETATICAKLVPEPRSALMVWKIRLGHAQIAFSELCATSTGLLQRLAQVINSGNRHLKSFSFSKAFTVIK